MSTESQSLDHLEIRLEEFRIRFEKENSSYAESLQKITSLKISRLKPICESGFLFYKFSLSILEMLEKLVKVKEKQYLPSIGWRLYRDICDISKLFSIKYGKRFKTDLVAFQVSELNQSDFFDALSCSAKFWKENAGFLKKIESACTVEYTYDYEKKSFVEPAKLDWHSVYLLGLEFGEILVQIMRAIESINIQLYAPKNDDLS